MSPAASTTGSSAPAATPGRGPPIRMKPDPTKTAASTVATVRTDPRLLPHRGRREAELRVPVVVDTGTEDRKPGGTARGSPGGPSGLPSGAGVGPRRARAGPQLVQAVAESGDVRVVGGVLVRQKVLE